MAANVMGRLIDFSHAGYMGGGVAIPDAAVRATVVPGRDDQGAIQAAIDLVGAMGVDERGIKGAVVLGKGTYRVGGTIRMDSSGVVLRGEDGAVIVATGDERRSLIQVGGTGEPMGVEGSCRRIAYDVGAGETELVLESTEGLAVGDAVIVHRPSTAEWIRHLGMDRFPGWHAAERLHWLPGTRDVLWERTIVAIEGRKVTLDAPITTAIEGRFGGGSVYKYTFDGRISQVGIENITCVSEFDATNPKDEEHAWFCVMMDRVEDAWVRNLKAERFVSAAVNIERYARRITVQECIASDFVGEDAAWRGRGFFTCGQQTLLERCNGRNMRRDFTVGFCAAGPNVYLDCTSEGSLNWSGTLESWASGVLFENVRISGSGIRFSDRDIAGQGAGWTAANSMIWKCRGAEIECGEPPAADNWASRCLGTFSRDGRHVCEVPRLPVWMAGQLPKDGGSLCRYQLSQRVKSEIRTPKSETSSKRGNEEKCETKKQAHPLTVANGRFVIDGKEAFTSMRGWSWYRGQMIWSRAKENGPAITRWAPGRDGIGVTDDLEEVASLMEPGQAFQHHYGLWYERRRVNHTNDGGAERPDGECWAPFVEYPWARCGVGRAYDGLSKYDLTKWNTWYFRRLKRFADLCDQKGRILVHEYHFQHHLLESGAHYLDYAWRPRNAVQDTGMPDWLPASKEFYDVNHDLRRKLHRDYFFKCLDVLGGSTNVLHAIGHEFTGPLSFLEFWMDTILEWEKESGKRVKILLQACKAEVDAILADPVRGKRVDAVMPKGWVYKPDGTLYANRGGIDKADREQRGSIATKEQMDQLRGELGRDVDWQDFWKEPQLKVMVETAWASTPEMKYRGLREYRDMWPDVAVVNVEDDFPKFSAAIEANVPADFRRKTKAAGAIPSQPGSAWVMAAAGEGYLVYAMKGGKVELDLSGEKGGLSVKRISESGIIALPETSGGRTVTFNGGNGPCAIWLVR